MGFPRSSVTAVDFQVAVTLIRMSNSYVPLCVLCCYSERVCAEPEPRGRQGEPCCIFMGG